MTPAGAGAVGRPGALAPGTQFQDAYEILEELGSGGFGRVHKARQLSTGQLVAIKVLRFWESDSAADVANQVERFRRETRLCAELSHPNIVRLIDSGETGHGQLYAIFEYVPGSTLKDVLAREGGLGWTETVYLMTQVLDALACAHARGVVHRDLKPENIMVTKTGARRNALVLDFGLGGFTREASGWALPRLTMSRELIGTPCYAAPEQLRGETPSERSDLYSWALIFLECLTGEVVMGGRSAHEIIVKQLSGDPVPIPTCLRDRRLRRLFQTATAKAVEKREVTVEALLRALGVPGPARADVPASEPVPEGERRQVTVVSCGITVMSAEGLPPDIEELDELLHGEHERLGQLAMRAGGHVAAVTGGSLLIAFGYPSAREDDARHAVRTALRMAADVQRASDRLVAERGLRLELRTGIHTGLVIVRDHAQLLDMVGVTPRVATRLQELARSGEILASQETQRLLRGTVRCDAEGEHRFPELSHTLLVFRVTADPRPRADTDLTSFVRETPLVGRREPLGRLVDLWRRTQAGRGGALLLTGEPGIGKSRLVRELRRRVPFDAWLEARCAAESQDSPLRPVAEMFAALGEPLDAMLERRGFDLAETFPPLAMALSLPPDDRWPRRPLPPEREKELAFDAFLRLLFAMAGDRPVVFTFEDLHWADPTTLELIGLIVREIESSAVGDAAPPGRLLLVATARTDFVAPWSPTEVVPIPLGRLGRDEVETMVQAGLASGRPVPAAVLEQVIRRSDGVPLFVEEVTRVLSEAGLLGAESGRDLDEAGVPGTLRDLLAARLDAVSPSARATAQLAAVLGREFRTDHLCAAGDEGALRDDLRELTDAGLVFTRRMAAAETYVFKHALVRDAAYEAMTRPVRRKLHLRVATVLQEQFPEVKRDRPDLLAQHFERGGDAATAIDYWTLAGERTMSQAAYAESIRLFERRRALFARVPASRRRTQQELALTQSLGTAFLLSRGFTVPEVAVTFDRALALSDELGEDVPFPVLAGLWNMNIARSDRDACAKLLVKFERLAERSTDPVILFTARGTAGVYAFYRGEFTRACEELTRAREWYETEGHRSFIRKYGYDAGINALAFHMWALWMLGFPDRARTLCDEMLSIADATVNPAGLTWALGFAGNLARDRGDVSRVFELTNRSIAVATEQKLHFWLGPAFVTQGWANVQEGRIDEGIAQIQQGLAVYETIGVLGTYAYHRSALVEAHLARRAPEAGLPIVRAALARSDDLVDCFYEAEIRRLEGELLRLQGNEAAAEAAFRDALEIAQRQEARSLELRAATSWARLVRDRGRRDQARAALAPVYGWFTEGHDTRDLRTARALLAELE